LISITQKKPLILLGAGGHAKVLIDCLSNRSDSILGIVDPKWSAGEKVLGFNVLGTDEVIFQHSPADIFLVNGIGMVEYTTARRDVAERMRRSEYRFLTVIHPAATVANDVQLGEGAQIMAGAVLQPGTNIGRDSIVNTGAVIDHDCVIGAGCHICPGVTLAGGVNVGDQAMVGCGSTVVPGISIGKCAVIGAGSIVHQDMQSNSTLIQHRKENITERVN
jgi:UDP-perosamine 4-acetyltransferase